MVRESSEQCDPDKGSRADLELVRATLREDARATERFVQRMGCIPRFLESLRRGRSGCSGRGAELDTQELAQEIFARLWSRRASYSGHASLETWAYAFCRHALLGALRGSGWSRRVHLQVEPPAREPEPSQDLGLADERLRLGRAVADLPPELADLIHLRHEESLAFPDIARALGLPVTTAKGRYYRALSLLRRAMAVGGGA